MTETLQTRAQKIVGKIKHVLSGSSNRSIINFSPPADAVFEMYEVVDRGIKEEVERRREALNAKERLTNEETRTNALKTDAVKKLKLRLAQKNRREIIRRITLAKNGGAAYDQKYEPVMVAWDSQLQKAEEIIASLSEKP